MNPFDTKQSTSVARAVLQQMLKEGAIFRDPDHVVIPFDPPTAEPPAKEPPERKPPTAKPRVHHLVVWRHDGEVRKTAYDCKEAAIEAGRSVHWAIAWKYAILDGRDMIERKTIEAPTE